MEVLDDGAWGLQPRRLDVQIDDHLAFLLVVLLCRHYIELNRIGVHHHEFSVAQHAIECTGGGGSSSARSSSGDDERGHQGGAGWSRVRRGQGRCAGGWASDEARLIPGSAKMKTRMAIEDHADVPPGDGAILVPFQALSEDWYEAPTVASLLSLNAHL